MGNKHTVEQLPGEPIIVVTVDGYLDVDSVRDIYEKVAEFASTIDGAVFRITDVRRQKTTFDEMQKIIAEASKGTAGTTSDPRIKNVFVGLNPHAMLARAKLAEQSGKISAQMKTFIMMEQALTYVRAEIAKLPA